MTVKLKLQNKKVEGGRGVKRHGLSVWDVVFETKEKRGVAEGH